MEPKGYEKKPWFPYFRNMYEEIGENMMAVDAKGYEEKPWWPYVLDLQEKIDAGGGGGSPEFSMARVTVTYTGSNYAMFLVPYTYSFGDTTTSSFGKEVYPDDPVQFDVILYQGSCEFSVRNDAVVSAITGDISANAGESFGIITGDGTITITD